VGAILVVPKAFHHRARAVSVTFGIFEPARKAIIPLRVHREWGTHDCSQIIKVIHNSGAQDPVAYEGSVIACSDLGGYVVENGEHLS
jgi:hypothetical protein